MSINKVATIDCRTIASLTPYARNARTHNARQVREIAASIDEFGLVGGIVIRDGVIAKGHGTLKAIEALYTEGKLIFPAPGRHAKPPPDSYERGSVPVIDASGWTEQQFKAYVLADNKLAQKAGWDLELLSVELLDLGAAEYDLGLTGFSETEIKKFTGAENTAPVMGSGLTYKVIVDCLDEKAQVALLERLEAEGLKCKPLMI